MRIRVVLICILLMTVMVGCKKDESSMTVEYSDEGDVTEEKSSSDQGIDIDEVTSEAVKSGIDFVEDYYQAYANRDYKGIIDSIHSDLIESVGGSETAKTMTASRMYLVGEPVEYIFLRAEEASNDGVDRVIIETQVTYSHGQTTNEEFAIVEEDGGTYIVELNLESETYSETIINELFASIEDFDQVMETMLLDAFDSPELDAYEDDINKLAAMSGAYLGYEEIKGDRIFWEYPAIDLTLLYWGGEIRANYENISMIGEIEISDKAGQVGISKIDMYPEPIVNYYKDYFEKLQAGDIDSIMDMYSDVFYNQIDGSPDTWRPNLEYLTSEIGEITGYQFTDWNYGVQEMSNGSEMTILGIQANIVFDDGTTYVEQMIINYDDSEPMIQAYEISPLGLSSEAGDLNCFMYQNGIYYYAPLTIEEADGLGIAYDSYYEVGNKKYAAYDWIEGEDGMDEGFSDSEMTVESYAEYFGLRVPTVEELMPLYYSGLFFIYKEGLPTWYWTSEKDGESGTNPVLFVVDEGEGYWDFNQENLPVILVSDGTETSMNQMSGEQVILGRTYDYDTGTYSYKTLEGDGVSRDAIERLFLGGSYYYESADAYYYILEDGSNPYPEGFYSYHWLDDYSDDYVLQDYRILLNDSYYICLDLDNNLVDEGAISLIDGYSINDLNQEYIVYSDGSHRYVYSKVLADYQGNILLDYPNEAVYDYSVELLLNRYAIQYRYDEAYEVGEVNLYDLDSGEYLLDDYIEGELAVISDEVYVVQTGEDSLKKVNIESGESLEVSFGDGLVIEDLGWDVSTGYGLINDGEIMIDENLEVIVELAEGYYIDYGNIDMQCEDIRISFIFDDDMIYYDNNHLAGLMTLSGDTVFEPSYTQYSEYEVGGNQYIRAVISEDESSSYDPFYTPEIKYFDAESLEEVAMAPIDVETLSNGNIICQQFGGFSLLDSSGNLVTDFSNTYSCEYVPEAELLIVVDDIAFISSVYDIDGQHVEGFTDYVDVYSLNDEFLYGAKENGETWVLDFEGNQVYGPFDWGTHFYEAVLK